MPNIPMQNLPAFYAARAAYQPTAMDHYRSVLAAGQNNPRQMYAPLVDEAMSLPGMVPAYQNVSTNQDPIHQAVAAENSLLNREVRKSASSQTLTLRGVRGVSGSMLRNVHYFSSGSYPLGNARHLLGATDSETPWYKNPMYLGAGLVAGVAVAWLVMKK